MSFQIDDWRVQQYTNNVYTLSQQKGSRLKAAVRSESVRGKNAFIDRIGAVAAQLRVSRHSDSPQIDTPHSRRMLSLSDYEWGDLVDQQDKVRLINDPTNEYSMSAMWAMGRSMDDVIINAALGTAYSGEAGGTAVTFPNAQRLVSVSAGAQANLNVQALRRAKRELDSADVDPSIPRFIAINSSALESLLSATEVTSADYNSVKALVQGEIDTFLGFKFLRLERLPVSLAVGSSFDTSTGAVGSGGGSVAAGSRAMIAWAQDGLALGIGMDPVGRIQERADKSFATYVYMMMSLGAVRVEEDKVVEIICAQ